MAVQTLPYALLSPFPLLTSCFPRAVGTCKAHPSNFDQLWRFFGPILSQRPCLVGTPEAMNQNVDNKHSMRCWTCHTPLTPQNGVDLHGGVSIEQFICQTCGRHWYGGERPRPKLTADLTTN